MLNENEGSGKDLIAHLKCNTIELVHYLRTIRTGPFQRPSFSLSMRRKKLAGSGTEIALERKDEIEEQLISLLFDDTSGKKNCSKLSKFDGYSV